MINQEMVSGCFYGLALGDALCAPYEGGLLERSLWRLLANTRQGETRYTDDTQMSLDVAHSLLEQAGVDQHHLAVRFACNYQWSRGYGPGAAKMLKKIRKGAAWYEVNRSVFPQGSYGNGAAMRAPIIALYYYGHREEMLTAVSKISEITHCHPLAIEGAKLIALAVTLSLSQSSPHNCLASLLKTQPSSEFQSRLIIAQNWLANQKSVSVKSVCKELGNKITATQSCITAIYIALRFIDQPFFDMLDFIKQCGGDTDTIAAMAGSIWGAYNGSTDLKQRISKLESRKEILDLSVQLYQHAIKKS